MSISKRELIRGLLQGERPPYVPWSFSYTQEAQAKLEAHYAGLDLEVALGNHCRFIGNRDRFDDLGGGRFRDRFGVVWDRSIDKDIGVVVNPQLAEPTMEGYTFPDPLDPACFEDVQPAIDRTPDRYRVFQIGFSLYERAWTLRGMEALMMDMLEEPAFVHELLGSIADHNLAQIQHALSDDIDAVYFGDDWGQQQGLQMGYEKWKRFIAPQLERMYGAVTSAGKRVFIHSCGDVDELFDDLIHLGVSCFNPFQPEVMDVAELIPRYRGRLTFHGGLSTQRTLPFGSVEDVRAETRRLLSLGAEGGYILSPAHAVEGDVSLANMLAFIELAHEQAESAGVAAVG